MAILSRLGQQFPIIDILWTMASLELDFDTKQEVTTWIEYILKPVKGKVKGFGQGMKLRHRVQRGDEPWKSWEEVFYPVTVTTNIGEVSVDISSVHMTSIKEAVIAGCHELSIFLSSSFDKESQSILRLIYSSELQTLNYQDLRA